MIQRQMTLQPVALLLIAAVLLLLLTTAALERQVSVQGLHPALWNSTGTAHAIVAAPAARAAEPAQLGNPVTRTIKAAPGRAPVAPAAAAPATSDQRSNPGQAASQCTTKPGSDLVCSAP